MLRNEVAGILKLSDLGAGKELYLEIRPSISLVFTSSGASHESNILWRKEEKNHFEKSNKNSSVNAISEERKQTDALS